MTIDAQALFPLPPGDPDALDSAVTTLRSSAGDLDRLGGAYTSEAAGMTSAWKSPQAAGEASGQVGKLAGHAKDYGRKTGAAATAVSTYAAALRQAIQTVKGYQAKAVTADSEAGRQVAQQHQSLSAEDQRDLRTSLIDTALANEKRAYPGIISDLRTKAQTCATALEGATPGFKPGMNPATAAAAARAAMAGDLPLVHTADLVAAGGTGPDGLGPPSDPAKRAAWWAAMTGAEQTKVVTADPKTYGAMDGLPAAGRDKANRILLDNDIRDLEAKEKAGTLTDEEKKALAGARAVRAQLDRVGKGVDPVTKQPLTGQLLIYDARAFGGQGRAAIVVGDLDTAQNVSVSVPGLSSDVPSYMDNITGNALNLYDEARRAAPGESTAAVAWMGYDAPGFSNVGSDNAAENGAKLLAADVTGIQASRSGNPPHLTVVGHSYGSTTTAIAASDEGMRVDDIVLIGSPGAGHANTAADLHAGHVYVGANSSDLVTHFTRSEETAFAWNPLGTDPAGDDFGGTRFQAEAVDRNEHATGIADHSKYYQSGSESLYNIANVVTGNYGDVTTAEARPEWKGIMQDTDPEHDRKPTTKTH
jgi:pimeloyl-ACP methyl ester carboxylesterase